MENKENKPDNNLTENKARSCCACNLPKLGEFKQVITLRKSNLTIFMHKNVEVHTSNRKKSEEAFILHNIGERRLKRPDYISEMCQYRTKCIKCKALVRKVRSLIDELDNIQADEVLGVCEYCKYSITASKCKRCEAIVSKYESLKGKTYQNKQAHFIAWLNKVNDFLRNILDLETVCKHRLYRHSHSVLELKNLFSELNSPLSQRQPEITYFPTKTVSHSALDQSRDVLEDILKRMKSERSKHYTSDERSILSPSKSTSCACKYFMSKKMGPRRSMEVLPQEKYYPSGLITTREFISGQRRSSSAEYFTKKSGSPSDYSRDGTSKERGRRSFLNNISGELSSGASQDSFGLAKGSKKDEYGSLKVSKRDKYEREDEYEKQRDLKRDYHGSEKGAKKGLYEQEGGPKRDEYGKEKRSKTNEYGKEIESKRHDKLPGIAPQRSRIGGDDSISKKSTTKEGKIKETTKQDKSKTESFKVDSIKKDKEDKTKEGKTKESKTKEDKTKEGKTKESKTKESKTKEDKTKEGKTTESKTKEDKTKEDKTKEGKTKEDKIKEGKTKESKTKEELVFKNGKTKKNKSTQLDKDEDIALKEQKKGKGKKDTSKDDLKENKKGTGKIDKGEDVAKKGMTDKKKDKLKDLDTGEDTALKEHKKGKGAKKDTSKDVFKEDKKGMDKTDIGKGDAKKGAMEKKPKSSTNIKNKARPNKHQASEVTVIVKDDEIRKRLVPKSKLKKDTQESEKSVSDIVTEESSKKKKGKKGQTEKEKKNGPAEVPVKKKKPSSEALLFLRLMKEMRSKKMSDKEDKIQKEKDFKPLDPLPLIKRKIRPKVEPLVSESFIECDECQKQEVKEMIVGRNVLPFDPTFKIENDQDHKPLLFKIMQSIPNALPYTETSTQTGKSKKETESSSTKVKAKAGLEEIKDISGIVKYQLSNRKFIEQGWTVLPSTKISRKMNTYNMKLASPEFDFFKLNKKKKMLFFDTGEKLAEIYSNECGKWFYRNGNLALHCYKPQEPNVKKRYVVYSSGEEKENGIVLPITILGLFDQLGNAIIYDYFGNPRLKYNQSEGVIIDEKIGPPGRWKWHTLNDPPVLKPVFIDTYVQERDDDLQEFIQHENEMKREENEFIKEPNVDMLLIEFENFVQEKAHKLLQKFKPFQIRMKAVKVNEYFSVRILDQASVNLVFQDMHNTLKLNLGMNLINSEIVDTETSDVSEVATPYDRIPPRSQSVSDIQDALSRAKRYGKSIRSRKRSGSIVNRFTGIQPTTMSE